MVSMLLDPTQLENCQTIDDVLKLCVPIVKQLLTAQEQSQTDDDKILFYLTQSAQVGLLYSYPDGYMDEEGFIFICKYYIPVVELAVYYIRQSLLNQSITANGSGSIKSISSNGRSVTFASMTEVMSVEALPLSIKAKFPRPKVKIRMW